MLMGKFPMKVDLKSLGYQTSENTLNSRGFCFCFFFNEPKQIPVSLDDLGVVLFEGRKED